MSTKKGGASRPWYQATSCARNPLRIETGLRTIRVADDSWRDADEFEPASADFSKGRPAAERSNKLRLPAAIRNLITRIRLWLGKLFSLAFARVLLIFLVGFAASIAWQSYGGGVRKAIAGWSPRLAWLAPAPAPSGGSAERFKAVSLALASARQSLDKLSTEINRLEVQGGDTARRRATR